MFSIIVIILAVLSTKGVIDVDWQLFNSLGPSFFAIDVIFSAIPVQLYALYSYFQGLFLNPNSAPLREHNVEGLLNVIEQLQHRNALSPPSLSANTETISIHTLTTIQGRVVKLEREINRGSYGIVYQGRCDTDIVAVKRFALPVLEGEKLQEFFNEATIIMDLNSPYVLRCHDLIMVPYHYCLVVDYMPRGSLWDVLRQPVCLQLDQQLAIAEDITRGLSILHDRSIVHRDLKSLNVLIDTDYRAKIADFGLATFKMKADRAATLANMVGTLAWLAPEIVRHGKEHSKATDIYSLGLVIWELVTRLQPFKDKELVDIVRVKMLEQHENIPSNCPPRFSRMMYLCWKSPAERPVAETLVAELEKPEDRSTHSQGMHLKFN